MKFPRSSNLFLLLILGVLIGCGENKVDPPTASIAPPSTNSTGSKVEGDASLYVSTDFSVGTVERDDAFRGETMPEVILDTTLGKIRVRLDAQKAPATVDNFLTNYVATDHYRGDRKSVV